MGAVSKTKPIEEDNPFKLIRFEFNSDNLSAMFKIIAVLIVAITVTAQACNEAEEFTCGSGECIPSFTDVTKKMIVPIRVMRRIAPVPRQITDLNAATENASFSDTSAMEKGIAVMEAMSMLAAK